MRTGSRARACFIERFIYEVITGGKRSGTNRKRVCVTIDTRDPSAPGTSPFPPLSAFNYKIRCQSERLFFLFSFWSSSFSLLGLHTNPARVRNVLGFTPIDPTENYSQPQPYFPVVSTQKWVRVPCDKLIITDITTESLTKTVSSAS